MGTLQAAWWPAPPRRRAIAEKRLYCIHAGLQATGMDAGLAGNWVQLIIFLGICIGWISTYLWRVATKNMTYVRQARDRRGPRAPLLRCPRVHARGPSAPRSRTPQHRS